MGQNPNDTRPGSLRARSRQRTRSARIGLHCGVPDSSMARRCAFAFNCYEIEFWVPILHESLPGCFPLKVCCTGVQPLIEFLEGIMEITTLSRATRVALACAVALLTVLVTAGPVAAQTESTPKWDLFAGYQWLHPNITTPAAFGDPSNPTPFLVPDMAKGVGGALTYNVDPHWGLETRPRI